MWRTIICVMNCQINKERTRERRVEYSAGKAMSSLFKVATVELPFQQVVSYNVSY